VAVRDADVLVRGGAPIRTTPADTAGKSRSQIGVGQAKPTPPCGLLEDPAIDAIWPCQAEPRAPQNVVRRIVSSLERGKGSLTWAMRVKKTAGGEMW